MHESNFKLHEEYLKAIEEEKRRIEYKTRNTMVEELSALNLRLNLILKGKVNDKILKTISDEIECVNIWSNQCI